MNFDQILGYLDPSLYMTKRIYAEFFVRSIDENRWMFQDGGDNSCDTHRQAVSQPCVDSFQK